METLSTHKQRKYFRRTTLGANIEYQMRRNSQRSLVPDSVDTICCTFYIIKNFISVQVFVSEIQAKFKRLTYYYRRFLHCQSAFDLLPSTAKEPSLYDNLFPRNHYQQTRYRVRAIACSRDENISLKEQII